MRRVDRWETSDGALHATEDDARRHAERRYGDALTRLAHRAVRIDKYMAMCEFLEASLGDLAELAALRRDTEKESESDDTND